LADRSTIGHFPRSVFLGINTETKVSAGSKVALMENAHYAPDVQPKSEFAMDHAVAMSLSYSTLLAYVPCDTYHMSQQGLDLHPVTHTLIFTQLELGYFKNQFV
jgi:hypothetical protein